jgi:hypothetical protein
MFLNSFLSRLDKIKPSLVLLLLPKILHHEIKSIKKHNFSTATTIIGTWCPRRSLSDVNVTGLSLSLDVN